MKKINNLPRILKIQSIIGFNIICIFNNGESRIIDFKELFEKWKVSESDPEYLLLHENEFKKVELHNQTLSWSNAKISLIDLDGDDYNVPFELSPDILYKESKPFEEINKRFFFGEIIRNNRILKGLSQQDLATLSGTSKTYISRIENNLIIPEFSTLYKIVEIGLGRNIKVEIY